MNYFYAKKHIYFVNEGETLSGYVQGKSASDIEERTAIALSKLQIPFTFQARINPMAGLTGTKSNVLGEVEIDFLCEYLNKLWPINVQGEISHFFASWQADRDVKKKLKIDASLSPFGANELIQVPFTKLTTQDAADRFYREGFLQGWPTAFYEA
jgi:hypothetical protein